MKNQALFSSKDKSKKLKCRLLQFWFGTLRVKGNCEFLCKGDFCFPVMASEQVHNSCVKHRCGKKNTLS